jgi:hypothetical protein
MKKLESPTLSRDKTMFVHKETGISNTFQKQDSDSSKRKLFKISFRKNVYFPEQM